MIRQGVKIWGDKKE